MFREEGSFCRVFEKKSTVSKRKRIECEYNIFREGIGEKKKHQCEFNIERFSSFKCGAKIMKTVLLNHAKPSHKRDLINKQFDDVEHAYLNALRFEALATRASRRDPCTYNVHMLSQRALAFIIFN